MSILIRTIEESTVFRKILRYFPIRGHSYVPPDRVFGNIEKEYRSLDKITLPSEYHSIIGKHGKCLVLGEDWKLFDIKFKSQEILKKKLTLKMMMSVCCDMRRTK
ncbi:hypothetical protein ANN_14050 [Periplaneta americana]|uniref:Uncharacterized protein n=1 Tax=Periplaneta americana TaxID=6978 RepID=A0ABQ8SWG2_PERAM|nr:hypothetical protein ANN_14050 [Periplaneta americana]